MLTRKFLIFFSCYSDHRGTGPLKTTMDVIDAAKVQYNSWLNFREAVSFVFSRTATFLEKHH